MEVRNPPMATHESGSAIDTILAETRTQCDVRVIAEKIAGSDHRMVVGMVNCAVLCHAAYAIGKVKWKCAGEWEPSKVLQK